MDDQVVINWYLSHVDEKDCLYIYVVFDQTAFWFVVFDRTAFWFVVFDQIAIYMFETQAMSPKISCRKIPVHFAEHKKKKHHPADSDLST